jgi:hypothetical protein
MMKFVVMFVFMAISSQVYASSLTCKNITSDLSIIVKNIEIEETSILITSQNETTSDFLIGEKKILEDGLKIEFIDLFNAKALILEVSNSSGTLLDIGSPGNPSISYSLECEKTL